MKLLKTGVPGLDEIFRGGINEKSSVLVTRAPGTGKTILAMQFLIEGAKRNEPGIYITTDEDLDSIREYMKSFSFDKNLQKYEKKGMVTLLKQSVSAKKLVSIAAPLEIIKKNKVKRVVLDSLSLFEYTCPTKEDFRREVMDFIARMREAGVTLLVTSERETVNLDELKYKPQDFLFQGLVILTKIRKGSSFERCVHVAKMRGQNVLLDVYPFNIDKNGINVFPNQLPFSLIEKDIREGKGK